MKTKNIQFYVVMILGLALSLSFSIFEFVKLNSRSAIINLITAVWTNIPIQGFLMSKYSIQTKLKVVDLYHRGMSKKEIQEKLHINSWSLIETWINNYQKYGKQSLENSLSKTKYSSDQFKLQVLNWRKEHNTSYQITANHFKIKNFATIAIWQSKLNNGGIDALFIKQGRPLMHKKKIKVKNHKYTSQELTELERLHLENRTLHVENEYLKKLDALVQKCGHRTKKDL